MKKQILIGLLAFIAISCNKTDDADLNLNLIHQGNLYGDGEENISAEYLVIEKEEDWLDLLAKMDAVNNESDNFNEAEIDFDEFIVLACFDQVRGSAGFSIAITETEVKNKEVLFTVSKSDSGPILALVITQPYFIAKFPKTNKEITFTE